MMFKQSVFIHCGLVVPKTLVDIGVADSLAPAWCQAITWTNVDLLSIGSIKKFQLNFYQNTKIFVEKNVFKNVTILLRPQCVKEQSAI